MRRVLVIAPAWVGDTVMAQSVVAALDARGDAVDVLAPTAVVPIAQRMPGVSSVIDFPSRHGRLDLAMRWKMGNRLAACAYDVAIVLPNSFKSALVALFARIPERYAFVGESRRVLLTHAVEPDARRWPRMVDRYAALVAESAALPKLTADESNADRLLSLFDLDSPFIALCPGGEYGPAKRWPDAHFVELALELARRRLTAVIIGGPNDQASAAAIAARSPALDLVGQTTLADAIDLISRARAVVCNDTGLMHVAAAIGVPVAAIFGSTTPEFTPPLSSRAVVLEKSLDCRPCFARECPLGHTRCLNEIDPSSAISALERLGVV